MKPCFSLLLLLLIVETLTNCRKKDVISKYIPADSIGLINQWILDSMQRYSYWTSEIPNDPDYSKTPDAFFNSIKSSHDRFSWISNGTSIPQPSNSWFIYGFHYAFAQVPGYDKFIGVITFVNKEGGADRAGLQRGSYFIQVNGMAVDQNNLDAVNQQLRSGASLTLTTGLYDNGSWKADKAVTVSPIFNTENVVAYTRSFTANGKITGYIYYSSFDERYDNSLLTAFDKLKAAGASELILDLRYNAGGSVASSAKLAGMVATTMGAADTYVILNGNRYEGKQVRSLQQVLNTSGNTYGQRYADLQSRQLPLRRVFILTTAATASAAELVVNSLKPYLPVIQIGQTTTGKDEAGFVITDTRSPRRVFWTLEPIAYKLLNRANEGNYAAGLTPAYIVDETAQLPLADAGTAADPLVNKALQLIYGNALPGTFTNLRMSHAPVPARMIYGSANAQAAVGAFISNLR
jgi:hypothetical protein